LQLPLLDLCRGKAELCLDEMSRLYVDELKVASEASLGTFMWKGATGGHQGFQEL
jgi:hypothetical protein